ALLDRAFPLVILAVPILDSSFVIAKRIKYGQPIYKADRWHFHHRFANIGFSQRRTALYIYGWTLVLAALALALRFIPYSDHHGHFDLRWSLVLAGREANRRRMTVALAINAGLLLAGLAGALVFHSVALFADAGHVLSDVGAIALGLFAAAMAAKPAGGRRTFGSYRAEILSALA